MNTIIYKVEDPSKTYVAKDGNTKPSVNYFIIGFDGHYISLRLDSFNFAQLPHFVVKSMNKLAFEQVVAEQTNKFNALMAGALNGNQ